MMPVVSAMKCVAAAFAHLMVRFGLFIEYGEAKPRDLFTLNVTVACDPERECWPTCNQNLTFTLNFSTIHTCYQSMCFASCSVVISPVPLRQPVCNLCCRLCWVDSPPVLRPCCVHTLWFCEQGCADGVSHVWLGLVLQSRLFPLCCLASFVAPDLSHHTTEPLFNTVAHYWSELVFEKCRNEAYKPVVTCTMLKVAVLCACTSQTGSRIKVGREAFYSQFCNKVSAIKFSFNVLRCRLLPNS